MTTYNQDNPFDPGPILRAVTAAGGPVAPPREWFEDPHLDAPTPLTVTSDGRVYGHLAAWDSIHIGMPGRVRPPRSKSNYAFFNNKAAICADGSEVHVGNITLTGGHAPLSASASDAVRHYDDTNSAVIDVRAGEDSVGIWLAGAVRDGVTDTQVRAIRASAPSGDWRPIDGGLELVAACQVNVPGFPIARARVASGQMTALVAAGAMDMMQRRYRNADLAFTERVAHVEAVLEQLESSIEPLVAAGLESRKAALREQVRAELA